MYCLPTNIVVLVSDLQGDLIEMWVYQFPARIQFVSDESFYNSAPQEQGLLQNYFLPLG